MGYSGFNPQLENGLIVRENLEYTDDFGYVVGEVDLLIIDPVQRIVYLFEEKSRDTDLTRAKAKNQLNRAKAWIDRIVDDPASSYVVKGFFLCDSVYDEVRLR